MIDYGIPKTLDPTGKALTVSAWCVSEKPTGVVLAHGGPVNGYALVVLKGQPVFMVRTDSQLFIAKAKGRGKPITDKWVHLAGVLSEDKKMRLYMNGELIATAQASGLIAKVPAQGLQVGADDGAAVGEYRVPFPFKGIIDEVRVYHRALNEKEVAQLTNWGNEPKDKSLVLYSGFEQGKANDDSGNKHKGKIMGVNVVRAKTGQAMHFLGKSALGAGRNAVEHHWTQDIPILVRAMAKAGDTLFLIGPPDLVDEEETFTRLTKGDKEVEKILAQQDAALQGKQGAVMLVVNAKDGSTLARKKLPVLPVWDSLAVANGRLFYTTQKGEVVCLGE